MEHDRELEAEMADIFNDDLLKTFAHDQGLIVEWSIEPAGDNRRCTIMLNGTAMPSAEAPDAQSALDRASVMAIELLTRGDRANEPMLAFA
jgi:aerobic-type carbon monoxide dehydrogenase small subunit (CoxS/CutS family)